METQELLGQLRKEFGADSFCILGEEGSFVDVEFRSSGSIMFDIALGGGFPKGRAIEISGFERTGKTTVACLAIAEAQKSEPDKEVAILDTEHTFNPEWAGKLGVDINRLIISQPDTYAEKIYDMLYTMIETGRFSLIILDSLAGLVAKEEFEAADWDKDGRVGGCSKINARAVRKIINSGALRKSGTTLVIINQVRDKIGGFSMYGTPTTTVGGNAYRFAFTQRIETSVGDLFTVGQGDSKKFLGQQLKLRVIKNKVAPPFRRATLDLYYDHGMDKVMELVQAAKATGVFQGTAWLTFVDPSTGEIQMDGEKEIKFNGMNKTRNALVEDIEKNKGKLYLDIYSKVQQAIRG